MLARQDKTESFLNFWRKLVPRPLFNLFQPLYHFTLAFIAALWYGFPSRDIKVLAITGTKGKTSVSELVNSILEEAGMTTALSSTLRSKVATVTDENLFKMTTPGRFFLQRMLRNAVDAGCEWAIVEMTSQAIVQYRHRFIELDAVIFTGIHPEHIEAHGSFEKYLAAKLSLIDRLSASDKRPRLAIANADDAYGHFFLDGQAETKIGFKLEDAGERTADTVGTTFHWQGQKIHTTLPGEFNLSNILAAAWFATSIGVGPVAIKKGVENLRQVPGRMESLDIAREHGFEVIVDYAHTTGSLEEVYKLFRGKDTICVLGSCGGGRDKWKRPEMGKIAERYCGKIVLTNEDPYDEDPEAIVGDILAGFTDKKRAVVEMDRRKAIAKALSYAKKDSVVLITGKGTDPYIMGPGGTKEVWSDKLVAEEELAKLKK